MELLENELNKLYDDNNDKSDLEFNNALKRNKRLSPYIRLYEKCVNSV
jgi:hypothetical protein